MTEPTFGSVTVTVTVEATVTGAPIETDRYEMRVLPHCLRVTYQGTGTGWTVDNITARGPRILKGGNASKCNNQSIYWTRYTGINGRDRWTSAGEPPAWVMAFVVANTPDLGGDL